MRNECFVKFFKLLTAILFVACMFVFTSCGSGSGGGGGGGGKAL